MIQRYILRGINHVFICPLHFPIPSAKGASFARAVKQEPQSPPPASQRVVSWSEGLKNLQKGLRGVCLREMDVPSCCHTIYNKMLYNLYSLHFQKLAN